MTHCVRLSPRDARLLIRYLDGVDEVVTSRFTGGFNPHEDHLTDLLCEMLSDRIAAQHNLPYPLQSLRRDLTNGGRLLDVSLEIEAKRYSQQVEGRVTFADFGVIISHRDYVRPSNSFERAVLFQAKRLHRSGNRADFSLHDAFGAFDQQQLKQLSDLIRGPLMKDGQLGCDWDGTFCYYLFYCPRLEAYDPQSREDLAYYTTPGGGWLDGWNRMEMQFHALAEAQLLLEVSSDPTRHFPAMLASPLDWLVQMYFVNRDNILQSSGNHEKVLARHVYERLWTGYHREAVIPFSWFLVYHMLLGRSGSCSPNALRIARGLIRDDEDVPVRPRYVITLRSQAGRERG